MVIRYGENRSGKYKDWEREGKAVGRGHLWDGMETWDREDVGVTLVETPSLRNMEPEVAISCSQAGLPVDGGGYQPTHKTFIPKSCKMCKNKDGA